MTISLNRINAGKRCLAAGQVGMLVFTVMLAVSVMPLQVSGVWAQDVTAQTQKAEEAKDQAPSADEGTAEDAAPKEATNTSHLSEAGRFSFENFDPTVYVLIILFFFAAAVAIERGIYLYRNRGSNAELLDILTHELGRPDRILDELIEKISNPKYGIEGRISARTLKGWDYGAKAMVEFSKAGMQAEQRNLDRRLVVLSTLGNNTPFIGLLGTVLGIMKAFRDLALMGDAGPAVVMKGISEALIATAFGLAVAIPCVIAFNAFSKRVRGKLSNAEEIINIIMGIRSAFETKGIAGVQEISRGNIMGAESAGDSNPIAAEKLAGAGETA